MNKPVNPNELTSDDDDGPLYAAQQEGVSRRASPAPSAASNGALMAFCLGVYYFLPFVRWDRGPARPTRRC